MKRFWSVLGVCALSLTGCGDAPTSSMQQPQSQSRDEPQSQLMDARLEFQRDALVDNVRSTTVTMLVKVNRILDYPHPEEEELKVVRYRADVVDSTDSTLTGSVEFLAYTDDDVSDEIPGEQWFVSVCKDSDGTLYLPDAGFTMPFDSSLMPVYLANKSMAGSKGTDSFCQ